MNGFLIFLNVTDTSAKERYTYHLGVWLSDMSEWESVRESLLWEAESPSSNGPPSFASTFEQRAAPYIRNITRCQIFTNVMLWVYFMNEAVYSKGAILNHKISTFSEICLTEFVSRKCLQGASLFVNLYISNSVSLRLQHNSGGNIQFLLLFSRFPTPNVLCKSE